MLFGQIDVQSLVFWITGKRDRGRDSLVLVQCSQSFFLLDQIRIFQKYMALSGTRLPECQE